MKWLLLLLLIPAAAAYAESEAPEVDARIVSVGHTPEVPAPGQQWIGRIELTADSGVDAVQYQICRVGNACFGPPTPATAAEAGVWTFDTSEYALNNAGEPVAWGINQQGDADWLVGVKYIFVTGNETEEIPQGRDDCFDIPSGDTEAWIACDATHYFTFQMPGQEAKADVGAPLPLVWVLAGLIVARRMR